MTPYGILIDIMVPRFARESVGLRYVLMTFCDGTFKESLHKFCILVLID
jgi:hypothetical protein